MNDILVTWYVRTGAHARYGDLTLSVFLFPLNLLQ